MSRLHLHIGVAELDPAIAFYSSLFGAAPAVVKDDYAKWMLDDPRVNLAISARGRTQGVDHLGIQVDDPEALAGIALRLKAAGAQTFDQEATTCCYARSDKSWVSDPAGVRWETFYTHGESTSYGEDEAIAMAAAQSACCGPATAATA